MPAARLARPALAAAAALLLAAGIAGCGRSHNPSFRQGYQAGLLARQGILQRQGPLAGDIPWMCAVAAYKDIQDMTNSAAMSWEDGFTKGCARRTT
jgi:hypothetical protein